MASLLIADDGMFGPVYRGSQDVAVKLMREATSHSQEQFERELAALGRCSHPHLVPMLGFSDDGPQKYIVYHYMSEGALLTVLHERGAQLPWRRRVCILAQVLSAVNYLHTMVDPIVHRDIKSANILLDGSLNAHLGDFGLARLCPELRLQTCGIPGAEQIGWAEQGSSKTGRVGAPPERLRLKWR